MKNMRFLTQKDQLLAALVFVLWSFGLVFTPYAQVEFASSTALLYYVYVALHAVVFAYTLYLLHDLAQPARGEKNQSKKTRRGTVLVRAALYLYTLGALGYSGSLLLKLIA